MSRIKWILMGCAALGMSVVLASSPVKAADEQSVMQPAVYRVDEGTSATTQLARHRGGGGFSIGIYSGPGWGYGGYYGGYSRPYYGGGYGYGYPSGYYYSYPSYGYYSYPSYGYYSYPSHGYYGGWYY